MQGILAYAQQADNSPRALQLLLIGAGAALGAAVLALGVLAVFFARRHRHLGPVIAIVTLWALVLCGSIVNDAIVESRWTAEYNARLSSGYYDPAADDASMPKHPWPLWGGLAGVYVGLLAWGFLSIPPAPPV